jgi:AbrB family looped-hinge helix DNA binding protein
VSVVVDRYGRIVLPRAIRDKYGVREGFRLFVMHFHGQICLVPVNTFEKPTEALYGSVKLEKLDEPKSFAREFIREKLYKEWEEVNVSATNCLGAGGRD